MSGGSYNLLCYADAQEIFGFEQRDNLHRMAVSLTDRGFMDAALETWQVLAYVEDAERQITEKAKRLSKVWKAIEWHEDGDYGADQVDEEIAAYRASASQGTADATECGTCGGVGEVAGPGCKCPDCKDAGKIFTAAPMVRRTISG